MKKEDSKETEIVFERLRDVDGAEWCARVMANTETWITLRRGYEECLKLVCDPSKEVYLAIAENSRAGFIIINMNGAFIGYIQTVCVAPEWRNRRVGSKMLNFAEERILRDSPNVFMCVSSFNKDAQRLYQRVGYEVVGELKDYLVSGHSEILLRKTIGPLSEFKRT